MGQIFEIFYDNMYNLDNQVWSKLKFFFLFDCIEPAMISAHALNSFHIQ